MSSRSHLHTTEEVRLVLAAYLSPRLAEEVCSKLDEGQIDGEEVRPKISEERRAELRSMARRIVGRGRKT